MGLPKGVREGIIVGGRVDVVVLIHQKLLSGYLNFDIIKQIKTLKRSLVCFHKRILAGVQERKDISRISPN